MTDVTLVAVLVGVSLALWVTTVAATAFVLYHFVYKSWTVMRKDMRALAQQVAEGVALLNRERIVALSDEEVAYREARMQARQRERVGR